MTGIVITSGARTPIGSFGGALSTVPAAELGSDAIGEALNRAGLAADEVSEVIMGSVLTAGQGMNPARQAAMAAGVPKERTAMTINQVCGSGLRSIALAAQSLKAGDTDIMVAGGQESMSLSPHVAHLRNGHKMGDVSFVDSMIRDGLWDFFNGYHMGVTAENVAEQWQITREAQDNFAAESQRRAAAAVNEGRFQEEIIAVTVKHRKGDTVVEVDEHPRETSVEKLAKLRPAFSKDGSVTAGNASGINDGAAAVTLMREADAEKRGIEPLGRIVSWATRGVDPSVMGTGPIPASRAALEHAGWRADDLDLVESNEAFAAQSCAVMKDLGLDPGKVNVNGGAIALGHPIGASGCRVLVTLLYEMKRRDAKKGLATLCIGGGMGIAMCVSRD